MWYKAFASFVTRATLAAVFLAHGTMKYRVWQNPDGSPLMKALFVIETLSGALVLLGLWTRWAAAAMAIIMVGTIHAKILQMNMDFIGNQGTGWELDLVILGSALLLTAVGAGRFSIDAIFCKCGDEKKMKAPAKKKK